MAGADFVEQEVHVKGLKELLKILQELPVQIEANIMRGAMRAGMKVVLPAARSKVHSVSGKLAEGLHLSTRIERPGRVIAKLKAGGPHAPIGHLVEYGTEAHFIRAREQGVLALTGGILVRGVSHPGARAKAFMRPALEEQATNALTAAAAYIRKRFTKEGIKAPDPVGDTE